MADYLADDGQRPDDWILAPNQAAEHVVTWAGLTGHQVATAPLAELFQKEADPFAEDLFFALLGSLGLGSE